jgi:hypothetical protein
LAGRQNPAYVVHRECSSDIYNTKLYTWILIDGYGSTMASGSVERLESLAVPLVKPRKRSETRAMQQ